MYKKTEQKVLIILYYENKKKHYKFFCFSLVFFLI